jgi:hypothetical protein
MPSASARRHTVNSTRTNDIAVLGLLAILLGRNRDRREPGPRQQATAKRGLDSGATSGEDYRCRRAFAGGARKG